MKISIPLVLVGVILVAIPPPAEGLQCVHCYGDVKEPNLKPCKDYKKGQGDAAYEKECTNPTDKGCVAFKDYKVDSGCSSKTSGCVDGGDLKACYCDTDLCNGSTKGGSGAGILLISLGLGLLLRQLCY